jgi:CheY-like chemotaxis protein
MATLPNNNSSPRFALVAVTNPAMRILCRETLRDIGFTVANGAESGTAVVTNAREQHPDLIILSEQLSDVPASEAVKWLRCNRMSATSPIIILGRMGDMPRDDVRLTVLPRPITRTQLREALSQVVGVTKADPRTPGIDASC